MIEIFNINKNNCFLIKNMCNANNISTELFEYINNNSTDHIQNNINSINKFILLGLTKEDIKEKSNNQIPVFLIDFLFNDNTTRKPIKKIYNLSNITESKYTSYLNLLKKKFNMDINSENITYELIIETLKNESMSTKKNFLSSIKWHFTEINNDKYYLLNEKISKEINIIIQQTKTIENKNELKNNQKKNFISWEEIISIHNNLKLNINKSKKHHKQFVILSIFSCIPPRRILDYSLMKIAKTETDLDLNFNYYIQDKKLLIFNFYKTKKTYGQQKFYIGDNELSSILDEYINKYKISDSLLNYTNEALMKALPSVFPKHLNKTISCSILRHSIITYYNQTNMLETVEEREKLAAEMAHSVTLQLQYYKKDTNKDVNKN